MDKMNQNEEMDQILDKDDLEKENTSNLQDDQSNATGFEDNADNVTDDCAALKKKYNDLNDSHLRLMAEFDNYRKRTLREKAELIKSGGENILSNILPVIDDFERAMQNMHIAEDVDAIREGIDLIYNKFMSFLSQQGVKPIEAIGKPFDTEAFDAVATIPASEENMKGKVIDCVQTGYMLHDKVIRHAKVVVGE